MHLQHPGLCLQVTERPSVLIPRRGEVVQVASGRQLDLQFPIVTYNTQHSSENQQFMCISEVTTTLLSEYQLNILF